jgi:TolB protein
MLRKVAASAFATLVLGAAVGTALAAAPGGPRLVVFKVDRDPARSEIATLGPAGGRYRPVVVPPRRGRRVGHLGAPAWSPNGSVIAFGSRVGRHWSISTVPAGGGAPRVVPGTRGGSEPIFSPDGRSLAFVRFRSEPRPSGRGRFESASVWIVDLETGKRRQLTRWREFLYQYPSSFSPDGKTLLLGRYDFERSGEAETVALRFDGRPSSLLVGEGDYPVYSPDGSKIALFRYQRYPFGKPDEKGYRRIRATSDLYVIDSDGTHLRRLTKTPKTDEYLASWDPSGERLAYSVIGRRPFRPGSKSSVMEINADGSCPTRVLTAPRVAFFGPMWRPGTGREAGRIDC